MLTAIKSLNQTSKQTIKRYKIHPFRLSGYIFEVSKGQIYHFYITSYYINTFAIHAVYNYLGEWSNIHTTVLFFFIPFSSLPSPFLVSLYLWEQNEALNGVKG